MLLKSQFRPPSIRFRGDHDPALRITLENADLSHLLMMTNMLNCDFKEGSVVEKEQFLESCPADIRWDAEVKLYRVARTLLPLSHWGPALWAKFVPSWILSRSIQEYSSSSVLRRASVTSGFNTYLDLFSAKPKFFWSRGIGRKTALDIFKEIDEFVFADSALEAMNDDELRANSFLHYLITAVSQMDDNSKYGQCLKARSGLYGIPKTRREVAEKLNVTSGRIAIMEREAWEKIAPRNRAWMNLATRCLEKLLAQKNGIPVEEIEKIDPWFKGVSSQISAFRCLVYHLPWLKSKGVIRPMQGKPVLAWKE